LVRSISWTFPASFPVATENGKERKIKIKKMGRNRRITPCHRIELQRGAAQMQSTTLRALYERYILKKSIHKRMRIGKRKQCFQPVKAERVCFVRKTEGTVSIQELQEFINLIKCLPGSKVVSV
jgi:hypothetical protein